MNKGIINKTLGNIVVINTTNNKIFFIGKEKRAKAYAASVEIMIATTTVDIATIKLFDKYFEKFVNLKSEI